MTDTSAQAVFSGTKPVDPRLAFDAAALERWMAGHVEGYAGPLAVNQFKGGQSNPTYELVTPGARYVLRRKPPGKLLPSAHAVDREYKVITALGTTGFPVPRTYGLCTDDAVIGTMFYVMEKVEGRILWDLSLPDMTPHQRRAVYENQVDVLAQLHSTDYAAIGLGDYGKPGNYFARQVDRWTKQYRASETETLPEMDRLIEWLPRTVPQDDQTSIVHGDFRLDNTVLHPTEPRIDAVLDWELSTLGNPMADFSYYLMQWVMPSTEGRGIGGKDLGDLGIPGADEIAARYCRQTGRAEIPDLDWYYSYNLFRLAGIVQGIAGRVRDGTAASAQAAETAKRVPSLAQNAWMFAQRAGA